MYSLLASRDEDVSDSGSSLNRYNELDPPSSPEVASYQSTSTPVSANRHNGRFSEGMSSLRDTTNTIPMNQSQLILDEIRKTNSRLDEFGETLKSVQQRLQMVERDLTSMGPSSSADTSMESRKKAKIPLKVRVSLGSSPINVNPCVDPYILCPGGHRVCRGQHRMIPSSSLGY